MRDQNYFSFFIYKIFYCRNNKEVVSSICNLMDAIIPGETSYSNLINYIDDRPGHDRRYAIDATLFRKEYSWKPKINFEEGIEKTVKWYIKNIDWCEKVLKKSGYSGERVGIITK